jgi:hypothetical protein
VVLGQDEIDLLIEDAILGGNCDRYEKNTEHVAAVGLDPRSRLLVVHDGRGQELEHRRVHARRQVRAQVTLRWIGQVGPGNSLGHENRG